MVMVGKLTCYMSEMQNNPDLTPTHVDELQKDVTAQETEVDTRTKAVNDLVLQRHRICIEWKIELHPVATTP